MAAVTDSDEKNFGSTNVLNSAKWRLTAQAVWRLAWGYNHTFWLTGYPMSGFIEGTCRIQATLFPDRLDDYISAENAIRVIDAFIDSLDLSNLGFKTVPADTARPAYHPSTLLKLFVYGYLNRIQSSRRLEREAGGNVELMWLLGRLDV